jgi:hypothetical protein
LKPSSKSKLSSKQYEDLGRIVASVYETGYLDSAKSYKMAFIKGMVQGFGGVIGATVVVALLLWILSIFGSVPFLGEIIDSFQDRVKQ